MVFNCMPQMLSIELNMYLTCNHLKRTPDCLLVFSYFSQWPVVFVLWHYEEWAYQSRVVMQLRCNNMSIRVKKERKGKTLCVCVCSVESKASASCHTFDLKRQPAVWKHNTHWIKDLL